jgi:hypothetical protein
VTSRRFRRLDPFGSVTAKLGVEIVMDNHKSAVGDLSRDKIAREALWSVLIVPACHSRAGGADRGRAAGQRAALAGVVAGQAGI